jgi:hypothetical protein
MRQVGVVIQLGHGGKPCPRNSNQSDSFDDPADQWEDDDEEEEEEGTEGADCLQDIQPAPGVYDPHGNTIMVIVDKSGVHHIPVHHCRCDGHATDDMQLLEMGLFAASFKRIKTAFTFGVLDDFLMDNLECKTSALHYFSKLQRVTCSAFPHTVPVSLLSRFMHLRSCIHV